MASQQIPVSFLHCHTCGKQVSTGFFAVPTQTPDRGLIVRASIECPECIEKRYDADQAALDILNDRIRELEESATDLLSGRSQMP